MLSRRTFLRGAPGAPLLSIAAAATAAASARLSAASAAELSSLTAGAQPISSDQSDISRTWVFGHANARQRKVWNTVKRGQKIALETAKIGITVGQLGDAVRLYYGGQGCDEGIGTQTFHVSGKVPGRADLRPVHAAQTNCTR